MIDVKVTGEFPRADFLAGREKALREIGVLAVNAAKAAAPVQRSSPGGHPPGTLRNAIKSRMLQKGQAIKVGIIGKSPGFFGRFVEDGHNVNRTVGYRMAKGGSTKFVGPRRAKVKVTIGHASPHPFFFPVMARISPAVGDIVVDDLEGCIKMKKV